MLARQSEIIHPSGVIIQTPLLLASFSSKGSRYIKRSQELEVAEQFRQTTFKLTEAFLISAYDLAYKFIPSEFPYKPDIVFVDSGGYELRSDNDLAEVRHDIYTRHIWGQKRLEKVLDSWDPFIPAVFVNYDGNAINNHPNKSYVKQIKSARKFFSNYRHHLSDILIKPELNEGLINIDNLMHCCSSLADFDIIGFTEKELGPSVFRRMLNIANIRKAFDQEGIKAPIHVFGILDPLSSVLYFIAGAEIFDGLTWLRYAYKDGMAIYQQNYATIALELDESITDEYYKAYSLIKNISYLQKLQMEMRSYLVNEDYSAFSFHSDLIRRSYDRLISELGGNA